MSQPISSRFSWLHIGKNIGSNINTLLKVIRHMLNRLTTSITSPVTSLYLIGLMFCLPFTVAYHHLPIAAFYGEWLSAALGVLAMLTLLGKGFWQHFKLPQISLVFLGLASIIGMQWMLGMLHSPQYALLVLSYLAWGFVLVILGSYLRQALGWEKIALTLAWFIVLGGALNVVFVGLQLALKSGVALSFMPKLPGYGALAQVNNFADYMALATASLIYLYAKGRVTLKPFLVGLVLFITMLAFSGSRSAWLYLGAITLLAIGLQIKAIKQRTGSPHIRSLLRMSLLVLPLFAVIQLLLHNIVPDSLISLPAEELMAGLSDKTASLRLQIWQTSWHLFTQNPWLGIGAGQMRWQSFLLLDTPNINATKMILEHSHNLFIHLLTEMGVAAALFVLIGLVAWARSFKWRELDLEAWWLIALLAIIGIHSMLEYPLWYTYFLGVFAFLLGAGEEKITQLKFPQAGQVAVLATTGIFMLISIVNLSTLLIANNKLEANVMNALKGNGMDRLILSLRNVGVTELQTRVAAATTAGVEPNLQHNEGALGANATDVQEEAFVDGLSTTPNTLAGGALATDFVAILPTYGDGAVCTAQTAAIAIPANRLDGVAIGQADQQRQNAINDKLEDDQCNLVVALGFGHDAAHSTTGSQVAISTAPTFVSKNINPNENYARYVALFHVAADSDEDGIIQDTEVFEKARLIAVVDTEGRAIDENIAASTDQTAN